jgi:NAD(P)H dehydrogenase (quinone)
VKNLIVLCHPNPKSFTNAICKTLEDALGAKGESFVTRNLYELKFNPVNGISPTVSLRKCSQASAAC